MPNFSVMSVKRSWAGLIGLGVGNFGGNGDCPQVEMQPTKDSPRKSAATRLPYEPDNSIIIAEAGVQAHRARPSWQKEFRQCSRHGKAAGRDLAELLVAEARLVGPCLVEPVLAE